MANRQTKGFPFVWERKIMKPQPSPRCGAPQTHHPVFTSASASLCNYKGFIEVNFTISYQISCESPTKNSTNKAFRILNACKDVSEITFRIHKQICYTLKDTHYITADSWSNAENPSIAEMSRTHMRRAYIKLTLSRALIYLLVRKQTIWKNVPVAFQPDTSPPAWRQCGKPNKASSKSFCHAVGNN